MHSACQAPFALHLYPAVLRTRDTLRLPGRCRCSHKYWQSCLLVRRFSFSACHSELPHWKNLTRLGGRQAFICVQALC